MKKNEKNSETSTKTTTKVYNYTNLSRKKLKRAKGLTMGVHKWGNIIKKSNFNPHDVFFFKFIENRHSETYS